MSNLPRDVPAVAPLSRPTGGLDRRDLFKLAGLAAAGTGALVATARPAMAAATVPRWPGHQPGRLYLGLAAQGDPAKVVAAAGPVGMYRQYFSWNSGGEIGDIKSHQAAGRLPWVSFRPPTEHPGAWTAVASGRYDADLRARARAYAQLSKPVVVTFSHEPHTTLTIGSPGEFAAAWCRVHDVMKSETGLKNIASVPILGDWVFNPINKMGPEAGAYLTAAVLSRAHFIGIDLYQSRSGFTFGDRLPRILSFLDARGHSNLMVGIGETGACNTYGTPSGAAWWNSSWAWATAHTDRLGAISYFNSLAFNNSGNNWLLTESRDKLAAFRASVTSSTACRLP